LWLPIESIDSFGSLCTSIIYELAMVCCGGKREPVMECGMPRSAPHRRRSLVARCWICKACRQRQSPPQGGGEGVDSSAVDGATNTTVNTKQLRDASAQSVK
jgi:hypothetical protein